MDYSRNFYFTTSNHLPSLSDERGRRIVICPGGFHLFLNFLVCNVLFQLRTPQICICCFQLLFFSTFRHWIIQIKKQSALIKSSGNIVVSASGVD